MFEFDLNTDIRRRSEIVKTQKSGELINGACSIPSCQSDTNRIVGSIIVWLGHVCVADFSAAASYNLQESAILAFSLSMGSVSLQLI
jgi:hypothetical protein